MSTILNLLGLLFSIYVFWFILTPRMVSRRLVASYNNPGGRYYMNPVMAFGVFTICSGPLFLGQFSLFKYGFYFIMLIYMIFSGKIRPVASGAVLAYSLFMAWIAFDANYSGAVYDASMLLIKYIMPLFTLWLGYSALECRDDFYNLCKAIAKCSFWYALLIGGLSAKFTPWLYFSSFGQMFLTYAGLADYFTAICGVTLVLYVLTNEKKWLFYLGWMLLSTILESVRTGLGGLAMTVSVFYLLRYKLKAIPVVILIVGIFVGTILFVPEVGEKFFGDNAATMTASDVTNSSLDDMNTNGRGELWDLVMYLFYEPNQLTGAGTGTVSQFMKERSVQESTIALLHSDYVQILCDNGDIGLYLWISFYVVSILSVMGKVWTTGNEWVRLSGSLAVGSFAGIALAMGFDNVVSHSMSSLIIPFFFLGVYYKMKEIQS